MSNTAIVVVPDHPTPISIKTHSDDPVPFLIYKPGTKPDGISCYDEISAEKGSLGLLEPEQFIKEVFD